MLFYFVLYIVFRFSVNLLHIILLHSIFCWAGGLDRMLQVGFAELKASYKRFAAELSDNAFDTLGALALVEDAQSKKQNQSLISMSMLLEFKGLLMQRFSKFIEEQVCFFYDSECPRFCWLAFRVLRKFNYYRGFTTVQV